MLFEDYLSHYLKPRYLVLHHLINLINEIFFQSKIHIFDLNLKIVRYLPLIFLSYTKVNYIDPPYHACIWRLDKDFQDLKILFIYILGLAS